MKYTLENFFEELEPTELDEIMPDNLEAKLPKKALKRIEKTALQKAGIKNNRRHFNVRIFAPAAACLILTATIGGTAMAAEAKEYNAAVDFFEQNGLSSEGLSREDIKAVYHDITTNRFMNDKTVEVIRRSVPGVEILQHEPTPEELSALWNSNINAWSGSHTNAAVEYRIDYKHQPGGEYDILDIITVECLRNGETLWITDFPALGKKWGDDELYITDCVMTSMGTAVWGQRHHWAEVTESSKGGYLTYSWIARIDDSGCKLWEKELEHGFNHEYIKAVLDNGDGTLDVISYGDFEYLCLSQYDADGNELSFTKTQFSHISDILNAVHLGDGYLVQLAGTDEDDGHAHLAKLDRAGNVTDNFVYKSEECDYYITDMAEFENRVYLSAYAVPKQTDEGGRHEIANILDYVYSKENMWEISSEELTPIVRDNYTAVLLLCDPDGGEPKNFYSVKGSLGGALAVRDDQLNWNVESIASTFYSPYTNSFSISGSCLVYRYSFNKSGVLAGYEDTGEVMLYSR
ncbi:MAG: hypothetical protein K2J79_10470 [Ruminiclostridium sp.]|nr:hypothetical protein [Ruminiclostridium sp.]